MDAVTSVVEKAKGFAKSGQNFVNGLIRHRENTFSRNPIEILKRLQREAFSDLMKLRDRQDKVERILSFYKTSKGSPFQEANTHIKGEVDVLGAILMMGDTDQQHYDALDRAGIRTGICSRFRFETTLRQKDILVTDFVASEKGNGLIGDTSGGRLSLAKLCYVANINDWISASAIPVGAQFRDLDSTENSIHQGKGLTNISSFQPPLLHQHGGSAVGLTVRKSDVIASLAQSIAGMGTQQYSGGITHSLSTFAQVACQPIRGVNLSLLGLHQVQKSLNNYIGRGTLSIPVGFLKQLKASETTDEDTSPSSRISTQDTFSTRSVAMKLESQLVEGTKLGGWIEMQNSNSKHLRWAVTVTDNYEDELGWGASLGGTFDAHKGLDQYQFESFANINLGQRFCLKPGAAYVVDGDAKILALMLRCNWSI